MCKNEGELPSWVTLHQIRSIVNSFWGSGIHDNVIISLFEKGEFKNLKEIHTFLENRVIKPYKEEGKSKQEIVESIKLPFVNITHPLLGPFFYKNTNSPFKRDRALLGEGGLIGKYESGMSTRGILRTLNRKVKLINSFLIFQRTLRFFWANECRIILSALSEILNMQETKLFLDRLLFRFLNGESREEILEGLGLPSAAYIQQIRNEIENHPLQGEEAKAFKIEKIRGLVSMVKKSLNKEEVEFDDHQLHASWKPLVDL